MRRLFEILWNNKGLILIIILGLVPLLWFKKDLLIAGGDGYSLLNPAAFADSFRYVWNDKLPNAGGVVLSVPKLIPMIYFWSILESFNVSLRTIEMIWAVALFLLPGLTMYYFMSQVSGKGWARVVASVFYMFNLFVLVAGPFQDNIKPVFIALPLMFSLWIRGLDSRGQIRFIYPILISLCSIIYTGSNVNPPTVAIIPLVFLLYLVFRWVNGRKFLVSDLKFGLATGIWYFWLNFWWEVNFIANILGSSNDIKKVATFSALGTGSVNDFLRLLGSWGWRVSHYLMPYFPYARFYDDFPLIFLSFLIPLLVFSVLLYKSRTRLVSFFALLAITGLFLSKGGAEPLGILYKWIWETIPGFWVFREPFSKFTPITVFAYSTLMGFSVELMANSVSRWRGKFHQVGKFLGAPVLPVCVIALILVVSYPILNGEVIWNYWNGSMRTYHVKVPDYWQELKDWLRGFDSRSRMFLTPIGGYGVSYNWVNGISSADAPATVLIENPVLRSSPPMSLADGLVGKAYDMVSANRADEFVRLISLLNTTYVLQQNDLDWRYSTDALTPKESEKFLRSRFDFVKSFGLFDQNFIAKIPNGEKKNSLRDSLAVELIGRPALEVYKMKDEDFLPKFYVADRIVYSNEYLDSLAAAASFNDYSLRTGFYSSADTESPKLPGREVFEKPNEILFQPERVDLTGAKTLIQEEEDNFAMPQASVSRDSPFYFLVKWKEKNLLNKETDLVTKTDLELWLSSKRLVEIEGLLEGEKSALIHETFRDYRELLGEIVSNLETLARERSDAYPLVAKANVFFMKHKSILEDIHGKVTFEDSDSMIMESYSRYRAVSFLLSQASLRYYLVNKPKEGIYSILFREKQNLQGNDSENLGDLSFSLDKTKISTVSGIARERGWYEYPGIYLNSGHHEISFPEVKSRNLVEDGSFENISTSSPTDYSFDAIDGQKSLRIFTENYKNKEISIPISNLVRGLTYRITFSYKTLTGNPLRVSMWQKDSYDSRLVSGGELVSPLYSFSKELERDTTWHAYGRIFSWDSSKPEGVISFLLSATEGKSVSLIDDIRVEKMSDLSLVLKLNNVSKAQTPVPSLEFMKVNPTKYRVRVLGAGGPFTLIFSESFNSGWKAHIEPLENEEGQTTSKSYFSGKVVEKQGPESYLDQNPLTFLSQRYLPEERHHLVNTYANSWYILPSDSRGQKDYEIVIEFVPQYYFIVAIVVSVIVLLLALGLILIYVFEIASRGKAKL